MIVYLHLSMFAIIDVEATGGNPKKDRLTEIAIIIHNGNKVVEQFNTLINPETDISPFISQMTGITNEMVAGAPLFSEIAPRVIELTEGKVFVAHNATFDYSFVNNEFKRLGTHFIRKQLCTVKLSRKILPGMTSYSLGKLCREMGIPMENRHRAFGDAAATAELFDIMLKREGNSILEETLKQEIFDSILPPALKRDDVALLPEETGVYYFRNSEGKVIFMGKAKSIRHRILKHFAEDLNTPKNADLKNDIHSLDYTLTGNDLVAFLMESDEKRTLKPKYNTAARRSKFKYGIYKEFDENGYLQLKLHMHSYAEPAIFINNRKRGEQLLRKMATEFQLCQSLFGVLAEETSHCIPGSCTGACKGEESVESYNLRVEEAVSRHNYEHFNFLMVGEGRTPNERSIVCVENGAYIGYGFYDEANSQLRDVDSIKESIRRLKYHPEYQKIIRTFLKKKIKGIEVIPY